MPWVFGLIACVFSYTSAYFLHYRIIITEDVLTVGAFFRSRIPLTDVIDTDIKEGGRSRELTIYVRDGRRIRVSALIGDFDDLDGTIRSRMAGPNKGPESAEKLKDRANRNRSDAFDAIGLLGGGLYLMHWAIHHQ
jgi:hypothetical protein